MAPCQNHIKFSVHLVLQDLCRIHCEAAADTKRAVIDTNRRIKHLPLHELQHPDKIETVVQIYHITCTTKPLTSHRAMEAVSKSDRCAIGQRVWFGQGITVRAWVIYSNLPSSHSLIRSDTTITAKPCITALSCVSEN